MPRDISHAGDHYPYELSRASNVVTRRLTRLTFVFYEERTNRRVRRRQLFADLDTRVIYSYARCWPRRYAENYTTAVTTELAARD